MAQSTGPKLILALFDGSVRSISPDVNPGSWNAAMQPNDGVPSGGPEPDD
jgi:hypothetical protein